MSREVAGTGGTEGGILLWFQMRKDGKKWDRAANEMWMGKGTTCLIWKENRLGPCGRKC
jgi:hypothetical protein